MYFIQYLKGSFVPPYSYLFRSHTFNKFNDVLSCYKGYCYEMRVHKYMHTQCSCVSFYCSCYGIRVNVVLILVHCGAVAFAFCGADGLQVLTCHIIVLEVGQVYGTRQTVWESMRV